MQNYVDAFGKRFYLVEKEGALVYCGYREPKIKGASTPLMDEAKKQLEEYFRKERKTFTIPLYYKTTDFRKRVYKELEKIPYGQVVSYGDLAKKVGKPGAARAVGTAMGANTLSIFLP